MSSTIEFHGEYTHSTGVSQLDIYEYGLWFRKRYRLVAKFEHVDDIVPDTVPNEWVFDESGHPSFDEAYQAGWDWILERSMNG